MGDVNLLLYLKDADYGKRLLRFLAGKRHPGLHPELVTAMKNVEYRERTKQEELVVLTDCTGVRETEKRKVIYLASRQDRERKQIFQYQRAENIYQELLWQLKLDRQEKAVPEDTKEQGIYTVLAPGGSGATVFSAMLAQYLGSKGNCLYLAMGGFPVYYGEEAENPPDFNGMGISELLFSLQQGDFARQERNLRKPFGKAWMLSPLSHFKDLLDCRPEDWELFLSRLRDEGEYDSIVVELGQLYEFTLDLLDLSHRSFLLTEDNLFGKIRRAVFGRYCAMEGKDRLWQRIETVWLSWEIGEWEGELCGDGICGLAENPQKMAYIKRVLEKGDGENVCVWDDGG